MEKIIERSLNFGTQKIYRSENDFGASVVRHAYSYGNEKGLWELAVIKFDGDDWDITYSTPITDDVIGHLTEIEVEIILDKIEALDKVVD